MDIAWELNRAWPEAELVVLGNAGHGGHPDMTSVLVDRLDRFASR